MNGEFEGSLSDIERIELHEEDMVKPTYFGSKPPTTKTALARAEKEGLKVVYPGPHELQIDIDGAENFTIWAQHFTILEKWLKVKNISVIPSMSHEVGHYHITIESERYFNIFERMLLQAVLGSDLKRELLGFVMAKNGESKPTLFLEKKD